MTEIQQYIDNIPFEKKEQFLLLLETVRKNIPAGFQEEFSYKMIGFVVPKTIYPAGYHCNNKLPLPFINIGVQKNAFSLHHLGLYADKDLTEWFVSEYPKYSKTKLDMGKGCVRFNINQEIPTALIGLLLKKMSVKDWIACYEDNIKPK